MYTWYVYLIRGDIVYDVCVVPLFFFFEIIFLLKCSYGFEIYMARVRFTKVARFLLDILAPWYTMGRFVVFALALKYFRRYKNISTKVIC